MTQELQTNSTSFEMIPMTQGIRRVEETVRQGWDDMVGNVTEDFPATVDGGRAEVTKNGHLMTRVVEIDRVGKLGTMSIMGITGIMGTMGTMGIMGKLGLG